MTQRTATALQALIFAAALTLSLTLATITANAQVPCKATTKARTACKGKAGKKTGYCMAHIPASKNCQAKTKAGTKCNISTKNTICHIHTKTKKH